GASARTVTLKYKLQSDDSYTTLGTISVTQIGGLYALASDFPALIKSDPISIRLENGTGGEFHIHDIYVEGNSSVSNAAGITSFKSTAQIGEEIINSASGTIDIQVPTGTTL